MLKGMKKIVVISLFLVSFITLLLNGNILTTSAASSPFSDVSSSNFAKQEIEFLFSKDIIKGYKVGSKMEFRPQNEVTRAQAAKMIVLAINEKPAKVKKSRFKDVSNGEAMGYIERAYQLNIINGYKNNTFRPFEPLTRAQMSKIISEAFNLDVNASKNKPIVFRDISASNELASYVNALYYNGISNGSGNLFKPFEKVSRAHFSAFLSRAMSDKFKLEVVEKPNQVVEAKAKVTATVLNVRSKPSTATNTNIIGKLNFGTIVTVLSTNGNWSEIVFNNRTAYVHNDYLEVISTGGEQTVPNKKNPLVGKKIVIDAGHGGTDPGAVNGDTQEKTITLEVSKRLENKLKADGVIVIMTREKDEYPTLSQRVQIAKKENAEIFVSIHTNSYTNQSANGTETYYDANTNPKAKESAALAKEIQQQLIRLVKTTDRGVKTAGFQVIREQNIPSVLVELAFISNDEDLKKLTSAQYQDLFAEAIYLGIKNYYSK